MSLIRKAARLLRRIEYIRRLRTLTMIYPYDMMYETALAPNPKYFTVLFPDRQNPGPGTDTQHHFRSNISRHGRHVCIAAIASGAIGVLIVQVQTSARDLIIPAKSSRCFWKGADSRWYDSTNVVSRSVIKKTDMGSRPCQPDHHRCHRSARRLGWFSYHRHHRQGDQGASRSQENDGGAR